MEAWVRTLNFVRRAVDSEVLEGDTGRAVLRSLGKTGEQTMKWVFFAFADVCSARWGR